MSTTTPLLPHSRTLAAVTALCAGLACASVANAQSANENQAQDQARSTTQSLNTGPSDSVMRPDRVTASPPLSEAERPARVIQQPARELAPRISPLAVSDVAPSPAPAVQAAPPPQNAGPRSAPPQTAPDDAVTRLLNGGAEQTAEAPAEPVDYPALVQGYYVRGDMDCDQVWPGEGDLAWLSDVSFTLDFGGCEAGQIRQVGPALWHEDQRCQTETGGDGGLYSIEYRQTAADTLVRKATLSIDASTEQDSWKSCPIERVPEEARFYDRAG